MEYFEVDKIDAQAEAIKNVLYNNSKHPTPILVV